MRLLKFYLVLCGVSVHVAVIALALIFHFFGEGRSPGEIVEKATGKFRDSHPNASYAVTRFLKFTGLPTSRKDEVITLSPFPGPDRWPAHGVARSGLTAQTYDARGVPKQSALQQASSPSIGDVSTIADTRSFVGALKQAKPGSVITLAPGVYKIEGRRIALGGNGTPDRPIVVRANTAGSVQIELSTLEGFYVNKSYWVFENLVIHGACANDSYCEHAFHVVGPAVGTVIRNNEIVDFNAAVKVNLIRKDGVESHADFGLVQNNSIYNTRARDTSNPVALLNINAGNGWVVSANFMADASKARGNRVSYAAFMKGDSAGGVFERNLVVCYWNLPIKGDTRVGLSFGGGGSEQSACRGGSCAAEHTDGSIRNNFITRCPNDVSIYLNRASRTTVHNNLLTRSLGVDVRYPESSAVIYDNILEGRIKNRNGGSHVAENNLIAPACNLVTRFFAQCSAKRWLASPEKGDLRLVNVDGVLGRGSAGEGVARDFCGKVRRIPADTGPVQFSEGSFCFPEDP